jgi:MtN3 and saliva related transmembrane protein
LNSVDLLAYTAGCIVLASFVPQIIKSWRTKKVNDLSLVMFYLVLVSNFMYLAYAIILNLIPVAITMGFTCAITLVQIIIIHKYRVSS